MFTAEKCKIERNNNANFFTDIPFVFTNNTVIRKYS